MSENHISRDALVAAIRAGLKRSPIAALLGPRQCGKTTLARQLAEAAKAEFIDLESR